MRSRSIQCLYPNLIFCLTYISLIPIVVVFCAPNGNIDNSCIPSDQLTDGKFYCSDRKDGWESGGVGNPLGAYFNQYVKVCSRNGDEDCLCEDCGEHLTECKEFRCDDAKGIWSSTDNKCYNLLEDGKTKGPFYDKQEKFYCYKSKKACNHMFCRGDEYLTECSRAYSGYCTKCPDPDPGKYYAGGPGSKCAQTPCLQCNKKEYVDTPCGRLTNTICSMCSTRANFYLSELKADCTMPGAYLPCTECDSSILYSGKLHGCLPYNDKMGYSSLDAATRQCKECKDCEDETYFQGEVGIKCVTNTTSQCKAIPLDFRFKSKRVKGLHNSNKTNNDGDTLPSYQLCAASSFPDGSVPIDPPPPRTSNSKFWTADCNFFDVGQCDSGRYLKVVTNTPQCLKCPNDNGRTPKGSTRCLCSDGEALEEDIIKAKGRLNSKITAQEQRCYTCSTDVIMPSLVSDMGIVQYPESVVCFSNRTIQRCGVNEIVIQNQCVLCPPGSIAISDKSKCTKCDIGTFFDVNTQKCVACNGDIEFCSEAGMLIPSIKTMSCGPTLMLNMNTDPKIDNYCTPCPTDSCPEQNVLIYANGRNKTNGCSLNANEGNAVQFFACYPKNGGTDIPNGILGKGKRLRFQQGTGLVSNQVFVDECPELTKLFPYAEWVDSNTEYPLGCIFACQYGWNLTLGQEYQNALWSYIIEKRPDLYTFWESVIQSFSTQQKQQSLKYAFEKVLWPLKDAGTFYSTSDSNNNRWEQRKTISIQSSTSSYAQLNTFLYLEDFTFNSNMNNLCLAPNQLKSTSCPPGFFSEVTSTTTTINPKKIDPNKCALWSRIYGIYKTKFNEDDTSYNVVVDRSDANLNLLCHIPESDLMMHYWGSYSKCKACMDRSTYYQSTPYPQSVWLKPNDLMPNRYEFNKIGTCDMITCSLGSVTSEGACIPCNADSNTWNTICSPSVFIASYCNSTIGNYKLTKNDVCVACSTTKQGPNVIIGVLTSNTMGTEIAKWMDTHIEIGWNTISETCMYICGDGYTSNSNETDYKVRPCVTCEEVIQKFISDGKCENNANGESVFNKAQQLHACNLKPSYLPFIPECTPCFTLEHMEVNGRLQLNGPNHGMVLSNDHCLALCDGEQYFTLHVNGSKIKSPIPQGQISRCEPCGEEHLVDCQNLTNCVSDYFWNGSECQMCNMSICNSTIGLYRTQCKVGSWFDSTCGICSRQLLFNDPLALVDVEITSSLKEIFNQSQLTWSRRWAPLSFNQSHLGQSVFETTEGCFVTCINNYAWIDLITGKPPLLSSNFQLKKQLACLPCEFLLGGGGQTDANYSLWNYSRSGGRYGGCYTCPINTDTIIQRDIMCESRIGYGNPIGNAVNVTIVFPSSDITMLSNSTSYLNSGLKIRRKRNLLQLFDATTISNEDSPIFSTSIDIFAQQDKLFITVPSLRMPLIQPSTQTYFLCCGSDILCRIFTKAEIDRDQNSLGIGSAYHQCISTANGNNILTLIQNKTLLNTSTTLTRRLFQSATDNEVVQPCFTSQYNTERGDNTCYNCPQGSSTSFPFIGKTSLKDCFCLPGYYRSTQIREGEEVGRCIPCGINRHRNADMSESKCEICPNGMITPTDTSATCYCAPGWYADNNAECSLCPDGSYCEGGSLIMSCPPNSMSKKGSKTRSDCICQNGFFGSLASLDNECMKLPFAQACDDSNGCNCTTGWHPIYKKSNGEITMHCISDCALGEYAQVNPSTFVKIACKKCPMHTYSSSRQTIEIIGKSNAQQCTPCPFNYETMAEGQTSVLDCLCKKGVLNSTTSQCGLCAVGTYLDPLQSVCRACPMSSTSPAGSIGLLSCVCPVGSRLKSGFVCEPCPLNTYSSSAGRICTPCPIPMITMTEGSKSFSDCKCPSKYYQHAGRCIPIA